MNIRAHLHSEVDMPGEAGPGREIFAQVALPLGSNQLSPARLLTAFHPSHVVFFSLL